MLRHRVFITAISWFLLSSILVAQAPEVQPIPATFGEVSDFQPNAYGKLQFSIPLASIQSAAGMSYNFSLGYWLSFLLFDYL